MKNLLLIPQVNNLDFTYRWFLSLVLYDLDKAKREVQMDKGGDKRDCKEEKEFRKF